MIAVPIEGAAPELRAALASAQLPVDDLTEDGRIFLRFLEGDRTVAFGGLELYGQDALLRSLVVLPEERGKGLGEVVTTALLETAVEAGATNAWLLTTSAAPFFEASGFSTVPRDVAPTAILSTRQAAALCPLSAVIMTRPISRRVK